MKKGRLLAFSLSLLLPLISSCSVDHVEIVKIVEKDKVEVEKFTASFMTPVVNTDVLVNSTLSEGLSNRFRSSWDDQGKLFVFAKQEGKCVNIDQYSIFSRNTTKTIFNVEVDVSNESVDITSPYQLYVLSGPYNVDDNELFYRQTLNRNSDFNFWFLCDKDASSKMSTLAGTAEMLFVINKTDKPINFAHKGYDVEQKWYYTNAEVSVEDGHIQHAEEGGEVTGDAKEIKVFDGKELEKIVSYYVPNGKHIHDAQLIAEIDGKEVRSENRISSNITLQTGHAYGIFAVWDGERLTLGDVKGNGMIEIPDGAPISVNEISVIGDGSEVQVNADGTFESTDNYFVALGKDDNIIYMSNASVENSDTHHVVLNATETAVTILLPTIPSFIDVDTDVTLNKLKEQIGELTETKNLADAIENSIKRNGYFDMNDIGDAYLTAHNKIIDEMGIRQATNAYGSIRPASMVNRRRIPAEPNEKPQVYPYNPTDIDYLMGVYPTKSEWQEIDLGEENSKNKPVGWHCEFTVCNARYAAMTVTRGWDSDGKTVTFSENPEDLFENIIMPASVKSIVDRVTTIEGITEQIDLLNLSWQDGHFHGMDETIVNGVTIDFLSPTDGILIIGPDDRTEVFMLNVLSSAICPMMNAVGARFSEDKSGATGSKTFKQRVGKFFTNLMMAYMKAGTIAKVSVIMDSNKPFYQKIEEVVTEMLPTLKKKFVEEVQKTIDEVIKEGIFIFSTDIANNVKELEKIFKEQTKWIKLCSTAVDTTFGLMFGSQSKGFYLPMLLDFGGPTGDIDIIPGLEI